MTIERPTKKSHKLTNVKMSDIRAVLLPEKLWNIIAAFLQAYLFL